MVPALVVPVSRSNPQVFSIWRSISRGIDIR